MLSWLLDLTLVELFVFKGNTLCFCFWGTFYRHKQSETLLSLQMASVEIPQNHWSEHGEKICFIVHYSWFWCTWYWYVEKAQGMEIHFKSFWAQFRRSIARQNAKQFCAEWKCKSLVFAQPRPKHLLFDMTKKNMFTVNYSSCLCIWFWYAWNGGDLGRHFKPFLSHLRGQEPWNKCTKKNAEWSCNVVVVVVAALLKLPSVVSLLFIEFAGDSANAVPLTNKLRTRVTCIWGDRWRQPNRFVQWKGLDHGEPPYWSGYLPCQVSMLDYIINRKPPVSPSINYVVNNKQ